MSSSSSNPNQQDRPPRPGGKGNLNKEKSKSYSNWSANLKPDTPLDGGQPQPNSNPGRPRRKKNTNQVQEPESKSNTAGGSRSPIPDAGAVETLPKKSELASDGLSSGDVQSLLECPVCFEMPLPPIYNCKTGHIICTDCRSKVPNCPLCRQGFSDVRNFIAEKLTENCTFKCQFREQGCLAMIKGNEIEGHSQVCNFRPLTCRLYPCHGTKVEFGQFVTHLRKEHRARSGPMAQPSCSHEIHVKNPERIFLNGPRIPFLLHCFDDRNFFQCGEATAQRIWYWVALLGTPEEAARYKATLTIKSKDRKDLQLTWSGPVHSIRSSGTEVYFSGLNMVTTEECLKSFVSTAQGQTIPSISMDVCVTKIK